MADDWDDLLKPSTRLDCLSQKSRISVTQFVRDRELGIRGMNYRYMNIKYCAEITQWSKRAWNGYKKELTELSKEERQCVREKAEGEKYFSPQVIMKNKEERCKHMLFFDYFSHKWNGQSIHISVLLENNAFIETILYDDVDIPKPETAYEDFYVNQHEYVEKYGMWDACAAYLFEHTSYEELMNVFLRTVRREHKYCDFPDCMKRKSEIIKEHVKNFKQHMNSNQPEISDN